MLWSFLLGGLGMRERGRAGSPHSRRMRASSLETLLSEAREGSQSSWRDKLAGRRSERGLRRMCGTPRPAGPHGSPGWAYLLTVLQVRLLRPREVRVIPTVL